MTTRDRPGLLLRAIRLAGILLLTLVLAYLLAFVGYHSLGFGAAASGPLAALFFPGPVQGALALGASGWGLWAAWSALLQEGPGRREVAAQRRLTQRELIEDLHRAPTPERAFHGYAFLRAEFRDDPAMLAELRRAFRPEWLPYLRYQFARSLRAGQFDEAGQFLDEMKWEWREADSGSSLQAVRCLLRHLRQPGSRPDEETLDQVLHGFRCAGLGATDAVLGWLARSEPAPTLLEKTFFREGGAAGRYLLRRLAERHESTRYELARWEAQPLLAWHGPAGQCALWPRERGESQVVQRGVERLELDLNPFGPEKAEQDPCLPDLFYRLSPAWEEITALQPGVFIVPPGNGRSAFMWMIRYESGLPGSGLDRVLAVHVPVHTCPTAADFLSLLCDTLAGAWCCTLARDPYALLGLGEGESCAVAEMLLQATGSTETLVARLQANGLPADDPDGRLLRELFEATAHALRRLGPGPAPGLAGPGGNRWPAGPDPAAQRSLLRESLTARELRRFCQDRSAFRPVLYELPDAGLNDMIDVLLDYCRRHDLGSALLDEIRGLNPEQYERHRPHLEQERHAPSLALPDAFFHKPSGRDHTLLLVDVVGQDPRTAAVVLECLFQRWLPTLIPNQLVPKVFFASEPEGLSLAPMRVRWDRDGMEALLRHRLERAGLVLPPGQALLEDWVEGMPDAGVALLRAAAGCPARLIRFGNRLVRRMAEPCAPTRAEFLQMLSSEL